MRWTSGKLSGRMSRSRFSFVHEKNLRFLDDALGGTWNLVVRLIQTIRMINDWSS